MNTSVHFFIYLAQFFLERKISQTKVIEQIRIHSKELGVLILTVEHNYICL